MNIGIIMHLCGLVVIVLIILRWINPSFKTRKASNAIIVLSVMLCICNALIGSWFYAVVWFVVALAYLLKK